MSASSKKKLRKEQNAAIMTQKQQAAAKEAKKLKIYTVTFWVVLALIVSLVAGLALKAPVTGLVASMTTALEVGDHKLSAVELNYFYIDAVNEYVNQYGNWISYMGLSTSKPLNEQKYDATTGTTWADQFLTMAFNNAKNTYALYDAAVAAKHTLSDEEKKSMQSLYDNMDVYAKYYGHNNANDYLVSVYGNGASVNSYKAYYEIVVMASSYYAAYSEELEDSYTDVALRDYEKEKPYEYNSYSYASFLLNVDKFKMGGTKGSDGKITYSADEIKAAEEYVKNAAEKIANADNNTLELLNAAIKAMEQQLEADKAAAEKKDDATTDNKTEDKAEAKTTTEDKTDDTTSDDKTDSTDKDDNKTDSTDKNDDKTDSTDKDDDKDDTKKYSTATENKDKLYSSVNSVMQEWIRDSERKAGDITFLKYTTKSTDKDGKEVETLKGYYVVLFQGVNDNKYALANVRHILVKFEGGKTNSSTGQTTYTDAEKNKAKEEAQKIYDEWLKGAKTEDSFAELAKKYTDDGNGDKGGLYEDIVPGQMVTAFNDWCFDEKREVGDHGIVETEYGWHVMFYSADSETNYRDHMITEDKLAEEMEAWQKALNDAMTLTEKNTSFVNKGLVLSTN